MKTLYTEHENELDKNLGNERVQYKEMLLLEALK
jgi:hypothetical protein